MRIVSLLIILLCGWVVTGLAQESRHIFPSESIETVRPEQELRIWSFFAQQKTFGQLRSLRQGRTEIGGQSALVFEQQLDVDYSQIGQDRKVHAAGESYFATDGTYLGCKIDLGVEEAASHLELERDGNQISGFFTRGEQKREVSFVSDPAILAWEADFVDQLEIWLSQQEMTVGDTLVDSILQPHSMLKTRISGTVLYWMWQEIYKGKIDSVFIIKLTEPQNYQLYFTADKKLVRVDILNQNIRLYQDILMAKSSQPAATTTEDSTKTAAGHGPRTGPKLTLRNVVLKSPFYVAFLIALFLSWLLLARKGFRLKLSYLSSVIGMVVFIVVPLLQQPFQELIIVTWLAPAMARGESLWVLGAMPALVGGIIQTGALYLALLGLINWQKPPRSLFPVLGAFMAGGFALLEAIYITGLNVSLLFSWPLLERVFFILFHVSVGLFLGIAIRSERERLYTLLGSMVVFNAVLRYLPLLVVYADIPAELLNFFMAFLVLAVAAAALFIQRSDTKPKATGQPG